MALIKTTEWYFRIFVFSSMDSWDQAQSYYGCWSFPTFLEKNERHKTFSPFLVM